MRTATERNKRLATWSGIWQGALELFLRGAPARPKLAAKAATRLEILSPAPLRLGLYGTRLQSQRTARRPRARLCCEATYCLYLNSERSRCWTNYVTASIKPMLGHLGQRPPRRRH